MKRRPWTLRARFIHSKRGRYGDAGMCDVKGVTASQDDNVMNARSRRRLRSALSALALVFASASLVFAQRPPGLPPIHPDVTAFVGLTTPTASPAVGVAFGGGGSTVRFEIEYAGTLGAATSTHSSAQSISANLMVQSGRPIHGIQFYGIGGVGRYGETFGGGVGSGHVCCNW